VEARFLLYRAQNLGGRVDGLNGGWFGGTVGAKKRLFPPWSLPVQAEAKSMCMEVQVCQAWPTLKRYNVEMWGGVWTGWVAGPRREMFYACALCVSSPGPRCLFRRTRLEFHGGGFLQMILTPIGKAVMIRGYKSFLFLWPQYQGLFVFSFISHCARTRAGFALSRVGLSPASAAAMVRGVKASAIWDALRFGDGLSGLVLIG